MPVPSDITVLSTTAASNSPPGSETPSSIDDYLRSHASFIAQMRAVIGGGTDANIPRPDYLDSYIDKARVGVASAATVNLTTGAPSSRHINITGTTTITAFTVASGLCFFVRFNAALTLTNNANIVTQSGANITTAQGDTCILRATAANVVEVLAYTPAKNQAVGYEQTWQDVVGSRALNTVYTNSTGKPIQIKVSAICSSSAVMQIFINGAGAGLPGVAGTLPESSAIIPNGATYRALNSSGTPTSLNWWELR